MCLVWGKAVALPRYHSYDFARQTTILCDFILPVVAVATDLHQAMRGKSGSAFVKQVA